MTFFSHRSEIVGGTALVHGTACDCAYIKPKKPVKNLKPYTTSKPKNLKMFPINLNLKS